jgi:hypothetical protein
MAEPVVHCETISGFVWWKIRNVRHLNIAAHRLKITMTKAIISWFSYQSLPRGSGHVQERLEGLRRNRSEICWSQNKWITECESYSSWTKTRQREMERSAKIENIKKRQKLDHDPSFKLLTGKSFVHESLKNKISLPRPISALNDTLNSPTTCYHSN